MRMTRTIALFFLLSTCVPAAACSAHPTTGHPSMGTIAGVVLTLAFAAGLVWFVLRSSEKAIEPPRTGGSTGPRKPSLEPRFNDRDI